MVHDRRIDGETKIFGNAGALYKNAMTWWDRETQSIWSQPTGRAIEGERKGTELFLLPSEVISWSNWQAKHPETLLMDTDLQRAGWRMQEFNSDFVIGVVLDQDARAYYYNDIAEAGIIQDQLGETPLVVWAEGEKTAIFSRVHEDGTLNFQLQDGQLADLETNSTWDPFTGLALSGPLSGTALRQLPTLTSYDWAWADFYPQSAFFQP